VKRCGLAAQETGSKASPHKGDIGSPGRVPCGVSGRHCIQKNCRGLCGRSRNYVPNKPGPCERACGTVRADASCIPSRLLPHMSREQKRENRLSPRARVPRGVGRPRGGKSHLQRARRIGRVLGENHQSAVDGLCREQVRPVNTAGAVEREQVLNRARLPGVEARASGEAHSLRGLGESSCFHSACEQRS